MPNYQTKAWVERGVKVVRTEDWGPVYLIETETVRMDHRQVSEKVIEAVGPYDYAWLKGRVNTPWDIYHYLDLASDVERAQAVKDLEGVFWFVMEF